MKRRCVTAQQCLNISRGSGKWKPHLDVIAECIDECPTGYIANENKTDCIKCNKSCPKGRINFLFIIIIVELIIELNFF